MQRSGTEAIRTQIQPSKQREHNGQPGEQLFPKRWPLSNRTELKIIPALK